MMGIETILISLFADDIIVDHCIDMPAFCYHPSKTVFHVCQAITIVIIYSYNIWYHSYPLVITHIAIENGPVEIVSFPI